MAVEVFQCNWGSSIKSFLSAKSQEKLFLQIDDTKGDGIKIAGKAYICNSEGKNEYISTFDYPAKDIRDAKKGEFQGNDALIIVARVQSLYGAKMQNIILPGLKDMNRAIDRITEVSKAAGGMSTDSSPSVAASAPRPVAPAPAPKAAAPAPAPAPAPKAAAPAPAPAPKPAAPAPTAPTPAPRPVAPAPAPAPAPAQPVTSATKVPSYTPSRTPAAAAAASKAPAPAKSGESYEQKRQKLEILHASGMVSDAEYKDKTLKLICEERGMSDYYEKISKVLTAHESGFLSDAEYAASKDELVREAFNPDVRDLEVFKNNTAKLPIIQISGIVSEDEFNIGKDRLLESVAYDELDSNDDFQLKLQKLPILVDAELVPKEECANDISQLKEILTPSVSDPMDLLNMKLARWPAMVAAGAASAAEFNQKKQAILGEVMSLPAADEDSLKNKIERVVMLKDMTWLDDMGFHGKKVEILKTIIDNPDVVTRMRLLMVARDCKLSTAEEFETKKQEVIADIFSPYKDMDEFKQKADLLKSISEASIISPDEFESYKEKLMGI